MGRTSGRYIMGAIICCANLGAKLQKCLDHLKDSLVGVRTSVMSIGLIETLKLEYYGSMTPLRELASITQIGKQYEVRLYDPTLVDTTAKLLVGSGFSAYISSKDSVAINIPQPSGEERKKIEKVLKGLLEETKIAMRNIRREARKASPDDKEIDKLTSEFEKRAEKLVMDKL